MSDLWYYRTLGKVCGPMTVDELRDLIKRDGPSAIDDVRSPLSGKWIPASSVEELRVVEMRRAATLRRNDTVAAIAIRQSGRDTDVAISSRSGTDVEFPATQPGRNDWYCKVGAQEFGPLKFEELVRYVERGRLRANHQVKFGATAKWRNVSSVGRLMVAIPFVPIEKQIRPSPPKTTRQAPEHSPAVAESSAERDQARHSSPATVATDVSKVEPVLNPETAYRTAFENATSTIAASMMAQAEARSKIAEEEAMSQIAWATAPNAQQQWCGWANGVEFGPVEFSHVFELAKARQLKPSDLVRNGQNAQFTAASSIPGLFEAVGLLTQAAADFEAAKARVRAAVGFVPPLRSVHPT